MHLNCSQITPYLMCLWVGFFLLPWWNEHYLHFLHVPVLMKCYVYVEPCLNFFFQMDLGTWLPIIIRSQTLGSAALRLIHTCSPIKRTPKHWLLTSEPKPNLRNHLQKQTKQINSPKNQLCIYIWCSRLDDQRVKR